ncbi:hypothetical protein DFH07DRAFT_747308 [Mycena maculata]|uniref:HMG box domain-containing protein n=1 Tax=Mycena maculata TaxID=230809 RepID=A0AAD7ITQ6_9AGAR|nr:hypothetical protein DFH07DRAFT_747308 [Mycena maculata]
MPSTPSAAPEVAPTKPKKKRPTRRARPANYVPRPRNSFMIFRSEFCAKRRLSTRVEDDHRIISRIAAILWHDLPEVEKQEFHVKAELEKLEHRRLHPDYRFTPTVRAQKPVKRKVQRNGAEDLERCREVAELLKAGKQGDELEEAVRVLNLEKDAGSNTTESLPSIAPQLQGWQPQNGVSEIAFVPELLPPHSISTAIYESPFSRILSNLNPQRYDENLQLRRGTSPHLVSVEPYDCVIDRPFKC